MGRIASEEIGLDQLIAALPAWIDATVVGRCLVRLACTADHAGLWLY